MADDEHLAYGDYPGHVEDGIEGERGFVGDTFRKLKKNEGLSTFFSKVHETVHGIGNELGGRIAGKPSDPAQQGQGQYSSASTTSQHRYGSFADQRGGSDVKWYVDGCGYMWAVSVAIERARESIWILDCMCYRE